MPYRLKLISQTEPYCLLCSILCNLQDAMGSLHWRQLSVPSELSVSCFFASLIFYGAVSTSEVMYSCKIWGSHSNFIKDSSFLGCDAVSLGEVPTILKDHSACSFRVKHLTAAAWYKIFPFYHLHSEMVVWSTKHSRDVRRNKLKISCRHSTKTDS